MSFLRVANVWSKFPGFDELTAEMNRMEEVREKIAKLGVTLTLNDFFASLFHLCQICLFTEKPLLIAQEVQLGTSLCLIYYFLDRD